MHFHSFRYLSKSLLLRPSTNSGWCSATLQSQLGHLHTTGNATGCQEDPYVLLVWAAAVGRCTGTELDRRVSLNLALVHTWLEGRFPQGMLTMHALRKLYCKAGSRLELSRPKLSHYRPL